MKMLGLGLIVLGLLCFGIAKLVNVFWPNKKNEKKDEPSEQTGNETWGP